METEQFAALLTQCTRIANALERLAGNQADGLIENIFQGPAAEHDAKAPPGAQLALPLAVDPVRRPAGMSGAMSGAMSAEVYLRKACGEFLLSEVAARRIAQLAGAQSADLFQPADYAPAAAWLPFFVMAKRAGLTFQTAEIIMQNSADVDQAATIMRSRLDQMRQAETARV